MVDAKPVCELHLIKLILKELELVAFFPGPGQLMLVENPELHFWVSPSRDLVTDELSALLTTPYSFFEEAPRRPLPAADRPLFNAKVAKVSLRTRKNQRASRDRVLKRRPTDR
jgi:hypothetical protein